MQTKRFNMKSLWHQNPWHKERGKKNRIPQISTPEAQRDKQTESTHYTEKERERDKKVLKGAK